jgi:hypothetical protein
MAILRFVVCKTPTNGALPTCGRLIDDKFIRITTTSGGPYRYRGMRRLLLPVALASLALVAPAIADTTTILEPPTRSPVTIPGSGLQRGERLSGDRILVRRLTEVRAGTRKRVDLRCPSGTRHAGLGTFERTRVSFRVLKRTSYIGDRTVGVEALAAPGARRGTIVRGSIFALCE